MVNAVPYCEGDQPPGPGYLLVMVIDDSEHEQGLHWINIANSAPIRHQNVDELLPAIRWTWRHLRGCLTRCSSFEKWELGFMRDTNPANEVKIWLVATYAFVEFSHQHPRFKSEVVFKAIIELVHGADCSSLPRKSQKLLEQLLWSAEEVIKDVGNFTDDGYLQTDVPYLR